MHVSPNAPVKLSAKTLNQFACNNHCCSFEHKGPCLIRCLLFISYKFVKGFLAITFLLLIFLAEIFMMCVNVFYTTRSKISAGSD